MCHLFLLIILPLINLLLKGQLLNKFSSDLNNSESSIELLDGFSLLLGNHFLELDLALGTSLESSHQLSELLVVVEVGPEGRGEVVDLSFVFLSHVGQGKDGSVLLVHELSKGGFSLDEAVGNVELSAEVRQPDDEFDGVNVVGNDNELGLLLLDEFGDVVESELKVIWLGILHLLFLIIIGVLSALNLASATNRALRCLASSGEYFLSSLNKTFAE